MPLLLTLGDPAGIGPEITIKAWKALCGEPQYAFGIIAPPAIFETMDIPIQGIDTPAAIDSVFPKALPIIPIAGQTVIAGHSSPDYAPLVIESIRRAVGYALAGDISAIVTNPIAKENLYKAGFSHPGHTEFLDVLTQDHLPPYTRGPLMMLCGGGLRVGLATVHIPVEHIANELTHNRIIQRAKIMHDALKVDFGFETPRIAIAALNPHAGEGGGIGDTEIRIINPAAKALRGEGINVTNAQPADTLFHAEARAEYDAALAMYHDQGLIPVKTLDFHGGVNVTLGLPIVRTSPDHGTAFNIAGQGIAREDSLLAAIRLAVDIAQNRAAYG